MNQNKSSGQNPSQRTDTFQDIPSKVKNYCSQNCSNYDTHIERIPIDDLRYYSTACGDIPNLPFSSKVISFIKVNSGKEFVIAECYNISKDEQADFLNKNVILNMGIHWKGKNDLKWIAISDKFADLISNNNGSLRPEESFEDGWDVYESE
jgi:hypothetical protein